MANEVIKKDGTKEPFDAGKIRKSITAATNMTDLSEERKNEIVEQVATATIEMAGGKREITTKELREKILNELDRIEPSVSEAWRRYDRESKRV